MTTHRDLKDRIRERQQRTGESYTAARAHVMRERAALVGLPAEGPATPQVVTRVVAAVLKIGQRSARVRILGETGQITFRSTDVWKVVPGHLVTLVIERRWTFRGDAYASGRLEDPRIDVARLGLEVLPLDGGEPEVVAEISEPFRRPDLYAPLWEQLATRPRPAFEFDGIAWGALPGLDDDDVPTCDASDLIDAGDTEGAREILMEVLGADLRCIDAHGLLGNLAFERSPARAMVHYEIGVRIGELSLPAGFDGLLIWGHLYNRPFLRCLHGYALCRWRLGDLAGAQQVFERILSLNPNDNQGVRFCWEDVIKGRCWEEATRQEHAELGEELRLPN